MSVRSSSDPDVAAPGQEEHSSEKSQNVNIDEKRASNTSQDSWAPPEEWLVRFKEGYTGQHGGETLPPGSDPDRVAEAVFTMNEEKSVEFLRSVIRNHADDYSFDTVLMHRCKDLVGGNQACEMEEGDWAYETCRTAGMIDNWSPYAEVRAVTLPYDDVDEACETFRAYLLGLFWVCVCTAINTCESPLSLDPPFPPPPKAHR